MRLAIVISLLLLGSSECLAVDYAVGDRVFLKDGTVAKVGSSQQKPRTIYSPSIIERIDGDRLFLGNCWVGKDEVRSLEEAAEFYNEAVLREPNSAAAWRSLAAVSYENGSLGSALKYADRSIKATPGDAACRYLRAAVLARMHGDREIRLGVSDFVELDDARSIFLFNHQYAISNRPKLDRIAAPLVRDSIFRDENAPADQGELDDAIKDYSAALKVDPDSSLAYCGRGIARNNQGDFTRALDDFNSAIVANQKDPCPHKCVAVLRLVCTDQDLRDPIQAKEHATKACELTDWKDWSCLKLLADVSVETGDFESAVGWIEKSLELAPTRGNSLEERLKLYRTKKVYRERDMQFLRK